MIFIKSFFDTSDPASISNRALHPSTTFNDNNQSGQQNINFVFSTSENIEAQCGFLYSRLPLLLMYLNEVLEFVILEHMQIDRAVYLRRMSERAEYFMRNKLGYPSD